MLIMQALGNLLDVVLFLALASLASWILSYIFTVVILLATVLLVYMIHEFVAILEDSLFSSHQFLWILHFCCVLFG